MHRIHSRNSILFRRKNYALKILRLPFLFSSDGNWAKSRYLWRLSHSENVQQDDIEEDSDDDETFVPPGAGNVAVDSYSCGGGGGLGVV